MQHSYCCCSSKLKDQFGLRGTEFAQIVKKNPLGNFQWIELIEKTTQVQIEAKSLGKVKMLMRGAKSPEERDRN